MRSITTNQITYFGEFRGSFKEVRNILNKSGVHGQWLEHGSLKIFGEPGGVLIIWLPGTKEIIFRGEYATASILNPLLDLPSLAIPSRSRQNGRTAS